MGIWGYSVPGLALNSARDIGGRLAAIAIYGKVAWGGNYAALAALTNIPAMFLGALIYEFILTDSARVLTRGHIEFIDEHRKHAEFRGDGKRDNGEHHEVKMEPEKWWA